MRISRDQMFMAMARQVSLRSTCPRLNVGAVLVNNHNIVSMGYNGSKPGEVHCIDEGCDMRNGGCVRTVHAEQNALDRCNYSDKRGATLYVTHSPCQKCAEKIEEAMIKRVIFEVPYRNDVPVSYLLNSGIQVFQCTPSGFMMNQGDEE